MKKNKPPLTAPVPVNVQWAARPPLVSVAGEKQRAAVSLVPCGSSISPDRSEPNGVRNKVYYMCVSLTRTGQMGPAQSLAACALLTCVRVFM